MIEKKVLFGSLVPHDRYINLALQKGENVFYEKMPFKVIDFPGEYDIDGILIKGYLGKNNLLSYILTIKRKHIAIIQTADILNNEEVSDMDTWLYSDDKIADRINHMELEGNLQKLEVAPELEKPSADEVA
ncbi:MAG: hypothetical protein GXP45_07120 [bacterium]|nr:hypothetical protein [bacterium]